MTEKLTPEQEKMLLEEEKHRESMCRDCGWIGELKDLESSRGHKIKIDLWRCPQCQGIEVYFVPRDILYLQGEVATEKQTRHTAKKRVIPSSIWNSMVKIIFSLFASRIQAAREEERKRIFLGAKDTMGGN